MNKVNDKQLAEVERRYVQYEAMIGSMTKAEREQPELLAKSPSRRWVGGGGAPGVAVVVAGGTCWSKLAAR